MQTWAQRGMQTALVTGGLLVLGTGIASAGENVNPDTPASPIDGGGPVPVKVTNNVPDTPSGQVSAGQAIADLGDPTAAGRDGDARYPAGPASPGNEEAELLSTPYPVAGDAVGTAGDHGSVAGDVIAVRRSKIEHVLGGGPGNAAAGEAPAAGRWGALSGDLTSAPTTGATQVIADDAAAFAGEWPVGGNTTSAVSGGILSTTAVGAIDGAANALPFGADPQVFRVPVEVLGRAVERRHIDTAIPDNNQPPALGELFGATEQPQFGPADSTDSLLRATQVPGLADLLAVPNLRGITPGSPLTALAAPPFPTGALSSATLPLGLAPITDARPRFAPPDAHSTAELPIVDGALIDALSTGSPTGFVRAAGVPTVGLPSSLAPADAVSTAVLPVIGDARIDGLPTSGKPAGFPPADASSTVELPVVDGGPAGASSPAGVPATTEALRNLVVGALRRRNLAAVPTTPSTGNRSMSTPAAEPQDLPMTGDLPVAGLLTPVIEPVGGRSDVPQPRTAAPTTGLPVGEPSLFEPLTGIGALATGGGTAFGPGLGAWPDLPPVPTLPAMPSLPGLAPTQDPPVPPARPTQGYGTTVAYARALPTAMSAPEPQDVPAGGAQQLLAELRGLINSLDGQPGVMHPMTSGSVPNQHGGPTG